MSGPDKTRGRGGCSRSPLGIAKDGQATSPQKHIPADVMTLVLALASTIGAARTIATRLALATDAPPFGCTEAADWLDEAAACMAYAIAEGGSHAPD
jgi:hypothetical protein